MAIDRPPTATSQIWALAVGAAALHALLALLAWDPTPGTGGDNAVYWALARSLAEEGRYLDLYDPLRPPHTQFPPVWPAMLALAVRLGAEGWAASKAIVLGFSVAAVGLSVAWVAWRRGISMGLGVGFLLALMPGLLEFSHSELSDVPFWALTALALLGWDLASEAGGANARARVTGLAAVATLLAVFTRTAGLPLLVAGLLWLAGARRWRALLGLATVGGVLLAAWAARARASLAPSYLTQFRMVNPYQPELGTADAIDLAARVGTNLWRYGADLLPRMLFGQSGRWAVIATLALVGLAIAGWVRRVGTREIRVAEAFVPFYLTLLLVWPDVWADRRFVLPLLPPLLLYGGEAVRDALRQRLPARRADWVGMSLFGLALLAMAPGFLHTVGTARACARRVRAGDRFACLGPAGADFFRLATIARTVLPREAVVISRKPSLFWAESGLPGRLYPLSPEPDSLFRAAERIGARYLVADRLNQLTPRYMYPILRTRLNRFCLLPGMRFRQAIIFGILPEGSTRRAPSGAPDLTLRPCPPRYLARDAPAAEPAQLLPTIVVPAPRREEP